jgi:hypothetical protein
MSDFVSFWGVFHMVSKITLRACLETWLWPARPASRPWPDLDRLKRATHSCLGYWPNPAWARRAGVWTPPRSRLAAQLPPTAEAGWCLAPSQTAQTPGFIPISHTQDQNQQFDTQFHIWFHHHIYKILQLFSQLQYHKYIITITDYLREIFV